MDKLTVFFALFLTIGNLEAACPSDQQVDPCDSSIYNELDNYTRSTGYSDTSGSSVFYHDYNLMTKWYRSVSAAGGDMPMTAPEPLHCQASYPIWMNGTLPTASDGIVERSACVQGHTASDSCIRSYTICVKHCSAGGEMFNVYNLVTPTGTGDRYCFGSEVQCPAGQTSPNGFTPGCADPTTTTETSANSSMDLPSTLKLTGAVLLSFVIMLL